MRTKFFVFSVLGAALMSAGVTAHAQEGFYDPSNAASPTGKTTAYELYKTIGCPGRAMLDKECIVPVAAPAPAPAAAPEPAPAPKEADSDGDGVVNSKDICPGTPAGRQVGADGCEFDSDGDGIVDGADKCPTVHAKTDDGCPLPLVLQGVEFDYDKATLRPEAAAILDKTAASLATWQNANIEVAGHTDSQGSDDYNMKLSQDRAEAVRNYLISKGIAADRLTAKGYGESKPVADNATEEGRTQNRRVELQRLN